MLKPVLQSENRKLVGNPKNTFRWSPRPVAVVMRAVGPTCPPSCRFLPEKLGGAPGSGGCYAALGGPTHWQSKNALPEANDGKALLSFITSLPPSWLLRLHVSGDVWKDGEVDREYVDALIQACRQRPDVVAWGYTHSFRGLEAAGYTAESFRVGSLVMNASCDSVEDAVEARSRGWSVVITTHSTDTRKNWQDGDLKVAACLADTLGMACNACLLCAKPRTFAVAFRHHGPGAKRADRRLETLTPLPMAGD